MVAREAPPGVMARGLRGGSQDGHVVQSNRQRGRSRPDQIGVKPALLQRTNGHAEVIGFIRGDTGGSPNPLRLKQRDGAQEDDNRHGAGFPSPRVWHLEGALRPAQFHRRPTLPAFDSHSRAAISPASLAPANSPRWARVTIGFIGGSRGPLERGWKPCEKWLVGEERGPEFAGGARLQPSGHLRRARAPGSSAGTSRSRVRVPFTLPASRGERAGHSPQCGTQRGQGRKGDTGECRFLMRKSLWRSMLQDRRYCIYPY